MRRVSRNLANCHATVHKLFVRQVSVGSFVIKPRFAFLLVKMDLATASGSEYDKGKKKIGFHFFIHV